MVKISRNAIGALGIGILGLLYLLEALKLPFQTPEGPGNGFMPVLIGATLVTLCIILAAKEILFTTRSISQAINSRVQAQGKKKNLRKPLIISLCLFIYPLALVNLGFIIATIPLLFICLRVMEYHNWLVSLLIAIVAVLVANVIFSSWLGVFLPEGILL